MAAVNPWPDKVECLTQNVFACLMICNYNGTSITRTLEGFELLMKLSSAKYTKGNGK